MKLRQCVFVCRDLESSREELCDVLGWEVAYRDPSVGQWAWPMSSARQATTSSRSSRRVKEGTSAGRYIERRKGDGGYMVIIQVADAVGRNASA